jgi:NAD dependent epimerase/dehydratase family enzyme
MHRPALFAVPKLGLNLVLGSELTSEAVVASQRVLPTALTETGFSFNFPQTTSIIEAALSS